jgi:urea carboxylase
VHALAEAIETAGLPGVVDLTPGIRSLQLHLDPERLSVERALDAVRELEEELPATTALAVPSRTVHLPLSWDDPATREAISRYMAGVRDDAPWCPWNIEFIRRMNGLTDVEQVRDVVYDAEYLVLGLGDVYLGAPVATPLDPRHRLVTTKYNPARTWTPENAVGIGGAYLCIYGMEGPGGYQFVGRTVQVWSRWHTRGPFEPGVPWLLRHFDRIRWYPVGAEELLDLRSDMSAGRLDLRIEDGVFSLAEHQAFLEREAPSIETFRATQATAFAEERARWQAAGEFDRQVERPTSRPPSSSLDSLPPGAEVVAAPLAGSVWRVEVTAGEQVSAGAPLVTLEAMKLEVPVAATVSGTVHEVLVRPGEQVPAGHPLVVVKGAP